MIKNLVKNIDYSSCLNYLLILYAFCLPISKAGVVTIEILLIVFWLLEGNLKYKLKQIINNRFLVVLGTFLLFSILSVLWSSEKLFALDYIRKYWHLLIIPIIFTSLKKEYLDYILSSFLISMLISEIVSYGIFFEIWSKEGVLPSIPSPFIGHIDYSIYLAFTVFILLHKILFSTNLKMKIVYTIYMLGSLSNLFVNGGRTGQIAFFISLFVVALLNTKHKLRAIIGSIIVGAIIFTSAYNLSPVFHDRMNYTYIDMKNMVENSDFTESLSIRVSLWIIGTHVFLDNPAIGTGVGDEAKSIDKYIEKYNFLYFKNFDSNYIDFHNTFIQYAAQLGIVGLTLFIGLFIALLRLKFKSIIYRNLNVTFISLYILLSAVGDSLHVMASMIFFAFFSGIFIAISKYESDNNSEISRCKT
ncbi:hypothetical protein M947_10090 [Sulfurimonas hongkongensis]|uniref:O-antigen ligase-related domain-containing protein n=1 Tax=Sulfurimonas hongkongensis TaxID=1172190 RepID=T0JFI1_9BACT|nr:O-antigen ligase family protein [Sulfurimonas hongkongensis]EQB35622.1 hypothetical protein M947_10090 [Sulfurimonas hongkongensis]